MKRLFFVPVLFSICSLFPARKRLTGDLGVAIQASQLLVKIKSQTGTDTTQLDYYYDANKRMIREKTTGMSAGTRS